MPHRFMEDGRIPTALTLRQYHAVFTEQADKNDDGLTGEAAERLEFTRLNRHRTERIRRTYEVSPNLARLVSRITERQTWFVLTEPWCGDSAQNLPYIEAMAALNPLIEVRLLLRDENLDVMDDFLTDGKRSIPLVVFFDARGDEIRRWGPRPAKAQEVFDEAKAAGLEKPAILEKLHLFYGRDRGRALEDEFRHILTELVPA
ncbi:thioredoxin family protein [bacterium DOLJORAL78_65_58]|nr:MAG: thioredoxin family protein [bacterium DOLZORAL124_64_63]PIE75470.1 MAG: thioredoxin family protein [bacterium DOLJORAL78_65_58]